MFVEFDFLDGASDLLDIAAGLETLNQFILASFLVSFLTLKNHGRVSLKCSFGDTLFYMGTRVC